MPTKKNKFYAILPLVTQSSAGAEYSREMGISPEVAQMSARNCPFSRILAADDAKSQKGRGNVISTLPKNIYKRSQDW